MNLAPYFYASQCAWINDESPLKLAVKSRQIGFSYCNAYRLVRQVSLDSARLDAFISSRDQFQAKLQLEDCLKWAKPQSCHPTNHPPKQKPKNPIHENKTYVRNKRRFGARAGR